MIEAVLYGVYIMSTTLVFAPTITTAFTGAYRLFKIIDRSPRINILNIENKCEQKNKCNDISFKRIDFGYPKRPDVQILNGLNLQIAEGKTIALVGPSGEVLKLIGRIFLTKFSTFLDAHSRMW